MAFYPSRQDEEAALIHFLKTGTPAMLGNLFLARLNRNDELRKSLAALIDQLVDNMATVRLAEFIRDHREELLQAITMQPQKALPRARSHASSR